MVRFFLTTGMVLGVLLVSPLVSAEDETKVIPASVVLERIKTAKEICERQSPPFTTEVVLTERKKAFWKKAKGEEKPTRVWRTVKERSETVIERPIVLCAFKESDQSWHVIEIRVPYPGKKVFQYTVKTPGYRLEHVGGRGVARLVFRVYYATGEKEEQLTVYRYLHSWFSPEALAKGNGAHLLLDARFVSYTPLSQDLFSDELFALGMRYLYGELMEAYRELREAGEPSKAFPQKLLADVIDWRIPFSLAANEQMDHDKFNSDEWGTASDVYAEFALDGPETFMWSFSNFSHQGRTEHAVGVMQLTNHLGTYDSVKNACPRARLETDFLRGAQNLRNALKAAICLLDIELARLPGVHALYRSDPVIGGVYPVIAYNAGGARARDAYNAIVANAIDLQKADLGLPEKVFVRKRACRTCSKKKGQGALKVLPPQTETYIKKYVYVLKLVEQFHPELSPPPSPPEEKKTEISLPVDQPSPAR